MNGLRQSVEATRFLFSDALIVFLATLSDSTIVQYWDCGKIFQLTVPCKIHGIFARI